MKVKRNLKVLAHIFDVSTLRLPYIYTILFPAYIYGISPKPRRFFYFFILLPLRDRKKGGVRLKVYLRCVAIKIVRGHTGSVWL